MDPDQTAPKAILATKEHKQMTKIVTGEKRVKIFF